ncbi:MAG TPA: histidine phosphatase family protein [Candidatus Paceibacterota bacterium]|nr:histidine phosphatase family protein [Candidatus Paceibacterota bacterium]
MIPIDLILVRHGESEGNVANRASRGGDHCFFTDEHRGRHSREFRLTDRGIVQAKAAGEWIRKNVPLPLDRFYVSDYIRAKETAYLLDLPDALWRSEFHLRERDHALMDNITDAEKKECFATEQALYEQDPFLAYPAGGGESFAMHCFRLKATMLEHWARECSDKRVIAVCHGHVMRALQVELEALDHDDFIRLNASDEPRDRIRNCQVMWYSRRDPDTKKLHDAVVAVRSASPSENNDFMWRRIVRRKFTNEGLRAEVERYPRYVAG